MKRTRLEYLADILEALDEEIRDHESQARQHQHMAARKSRQLEITLKQYYAESRTAEAAPSYFDSVPAAHVYAALERMST